MEETRQGGYRRLGRQAAKEAGLPVISVVTVVYNGRQLIEKTIASILEQTYPNIEYIVIDGGSSDGTPDIIRRYDDQIAWWVSERDGGIYDAMNKGLAAATGDFIWFMNAGDLIYRNDTLEKIIGSSTISDSSEWPLIYYGDTMVVDDSYREVGLRRLRPPEALNWKSFKKGMLVCHQAILVSLKIAGSFDPRYRHSADFDWVVRALKIVGNGKVINTRMILCAFLDGGHSKKNISISLRERFQSMTTHYGLLPSLIRHIPIVIRFGWYYLINKRF